MWMAAATTVARPSAAPPILAPIDATVPGWKIVVDRSTILKWGLISFFVGTAFTLCVTNVLEKLSTAMAVGVSLCIALGVFAFFSIIEQAVEKLFRKETTPREAAYLVNPGDVSLNVRDGALPHHSESTNESPQALHAIQAVAALLAPFVDPHQQQQPSKTGGKLPKHKTLKVKPTVPTLPVVGST